LRSTTPVNGARMTVLLTARATRPRLGLQRGVRHPDAAVGGLQGVARQHALALQLLRQTELPPLLRQVGLGAQHRGLGALDLRGVVGVLETGQDVPLLHPAAFLDAQLGQASLDLRRDDRLAARHDVSRRGQHRDPRPGDLAA
jgi:hypothetical protein